MRSVLLLVSSSLLVGCSSTGGDDTSADLPTTDTGVGDTSEPWEFVDTGGSDTLDEAPLDVLTIRQWGTFDLSPAGGPYTSLSGELRVQEYLNGDRPDTGDTGDTGEPSDTADPLACDVVYTLSGVPFTGTPCAGCSPTFRVEFALASGDPSACHDPELPAHEQQWTVAWRDVDETVQRDWGDAGLWQTWFGGTLAADVVTFEWEVDVGVAVEEEEQ